MSDLQQLKDLSNPFLHTDTAEEYEKTNIFCDIEEYQEKARKCLKDSIHWYNLGKLSNPLILLTGKAGLGKTFLLSKFAKDGVQEGNLLLIPLSILDIIKQQNIDEMANFVYQKMRTFLTTPITINNIVYYPIDRYAYKIYQRMMDKNKSSEKQLKYRKKIFSQKMPEYKSFEDFLQLKKDPYNSNIIYKVIELVEKQTQQSLYKKMAKDFLLLFLKKESSYKCENYIQEIGKITNFCKDLHIPIILCIDQIEDIEIDYSANKINSFFLFILKFIRKLREYSNTEVPLFLISLNSMYANNYILAIDHLKDRLPLLPNGNNTISLPENISFDMSQEICKTYMSAFWKKKENKDKKKENTDNFWPFSEEDLRVLYDELKKEKVTIRDWLILCRRAWEQKIRGEEIGTDDTSLRSVKSGNTGNEEPAGQPTKSEKTEDKKESNEKLLIKCMENIETKEFYEIFFNNTDYSDDLLHIKLVYVFIKSIELSKFPKLQITDISGILKQHYFYFLLNNKKIYVFLSTKNNQGRGFKKYWESFYTNKIEKENNFIICLRTTDSQFPEDIPILRDPTRGSFYNLKYGSGPCDFKDNEKLKMYAIIYFAQNASLLETLELPLIPEQKVEWQNIDRTTLEDMIIKEFKGNIFRGLL